MKRLLLKLAIIAICALSVSSGGLNADESVSLKQNLNSELELLSQQYHYPILSDDFITLKHIDLGWYYIFVPIANGEVQ